MAFSTANLIDASAAADTVPARRLPERHMDGFFLAAVEVADEAVLNALSNAETVEGYSGTPLPTLRERMAKSGFLASLT